MTTTLTHTASPPQVDLETRLALADAAMTLRLEQAQLVFDVNTAHQPAPAFDFAAPILPVVEPVPAVSPLAAVYLGAIEVIRERGWTKGGLRDEASAVCLVGAIRAAAHSRGQADDACAKLLDIIQRQFTGAETVPSWNDQQASADTVIRMLHSAATQV